MEHGGAFPGSDETGRRVVPSWYLAGYGAQIGQSGRPVSAREAVSLLIGSSDVGASNTRLLVVARRTVGTLRVLATRCVRVALLEPLGKSAINDLQIALEDFLSNHIVEHQDAHETRDRPGPSHEN